MRVLFLTWFSADKNTNCCHLTQFLHFFFLACFLSLFFLSFSLASFFSNQERGGTCDRNLASTRGPPASSCCYLIGTVITLGLRKWQPNWNRKRRGNPLPYSRRCQSRGSSCRALQATCCSQTETQTEKKKQTKRRNSHSSLRLSQLPVELVHSAKQSQGKERIADCITLHTCTESVQSFNQQQETNKIKLTATSIPSQDWQKGIHWQNKKFFFFAIFRFLFFFFLSFFVFFLSFDSWLLLPKEAKAKKKERRKTFSKNATWGSSHTVMLCTSERHGGREQEKEVGGWAGGRGVTSLRPDYRKGCSCCYYSVWMVGVMTEAMRGLYVRDSGRGDDAGDVCGDAAVRT